MDIQYWDPYDIPDDVTKKFNATKLNTIEDVCRECDFVSINCPATKETFHLMNDERFKLMKKSAFIINTARGDIIDEKALVNALVNKEIAGAALDVFETEPNLPNELKTMENVVSFPHLGSATSETRIAMGNTAIDNTLAFFAGTELPNKVV
jgi:lactate dehydrogenase-like 2-hydroxyacid dehydrogenase